MFVRVRERVSRRGASASARSVGRRRTVFGAVIGNSVCLLFLSFVFVAFYVCRTRKFALRRIIQRHKSDIYTQTGHYPLPPHFPSPNNLALTAQSFGH